MVTEHTKGPLYLSANTLGKPLLKWFEYMHMSMEIHSRSSQQRILTCLRKNEIKIESWVVLISKLQCSHENVINGQLIMPDLNSFVLWL